MQAGVQRVMPGVLPAALGFAGVPIEDDRGNRSRFEKLPLGVEISAGELRDSVFLNLVPWCLSCRTTTKKSPPIEAGSV